MPRLLDFGTKEAISKLTKIIIYMSYDDEEISGQGFKLSDDDGEADELEPLEEGAMNDFRFDEDTDDDPDKDH